MILAAGGLPKEVPKLSECHISSKDKKIVGIHEGAHLCGQQLLLAIVDW
jgi:hypothetical protein